MKQILRRATVLSLLASAGCAHDGPFDAKQTPLGPATSGSDVVLTYNPRGNFWPAWTEDDRGILYAYSEGTLNYTCMGLIPAAGGTQIWSACDRRATASFLTSFGAYTLGDDGRLIYTESVADPVAAGSPVIGLPVTSLWLADSAHPFQRKELLRLPVSVSGTAVTWLSELRWTGPTTFTALAQLLETFPSCRGCPGIDSLYFNVGMVVAGTITPTGTTLTAIEGTTGATAYSPAEYGASIVFTRLDETQLFKVPTGGGTPAPIAEIALGQTAQLLGVSCRLTTCIVASDAVIRSDPFFNVFRSLTVGPRSLSSVSLTDGTVRVLQTRTTGAIFASPLLAPNGKDIVVQVDGVWGHLQTASSLFRGTLHLLAGAVP